MKKLFVILMLWACTVQSQVKIQTSETLTQIGNSVLVSLLTPPATISKVTYYTAGKIVAVADSLSKSAAIWRPASGGYYRLNAVAIIGKVLIKSDTVGVYAASYLELKTAMLWNVKYKYTVKTFPDSLIELPEGAIVTGKSHSSTTLRTTLSYLNPFFK